MPLVQRGTPDVDLLVFSSNNKLYTFVQGPSGLCMGCSGDSVLPDLLASQLPPSLP